VQDFATIHSTSHASWTKDLVGPQCTISCTTLYEPLKMSLSHLLKYWLDLIHGSLVNYGLFYDPNQIQEGSQAPITTYRGYPPIERGWKVPAMWGWIKTLVPSEPQNSWDLWMCGSVSKPIVPLVNIKIAGKRMFIPLKMVCIGIDPLPCLITEGYL